MNRQQRRRQARAGQNPLRLVRDPVPAAALASLRCPPCPYCHADRREEPCRDGCVVAVAVVVPGATTHVHVTCDRCGQGGTVFV